MDEKIDFLLALIAGYKDLDQYYRKTVAAISAIERFENNIKARLSTDEENLFYLKILSLLHFFVLNSLKASHVIEDRIESIVKQDLAMDRENYIPKLDILQGTRAGAGIGFLACLLAFAGICRP